MIGVAFLIISSVIGAGFATGAELVAFFGNRNISPFAASITVSAFIMLFSAGILWVEKNRDKPAHSFIFKPIYFVFFCAMTAGIFELAGWVGVVVSLALCILVVKFGFDKVLAINKYLIFFILAVLFTVDLAHVGDLELPRGNPFRAIPWALLYTGMNVALLSGLFRTALNKYSAKQIFVSCGIAAKIIGSLVFLGLSAIYANEVQGETMPILALSNNGVTYLAIFLSIFTSQVISLFNLHQPSAVRSKFHSWTLVVFCVVALFGVFVGFSGIVGLFYPAVGFFMVGYIVYSCLFIKHTNNRARVHHKET